MTTMTSDYFFHKADGYDNDANRVSNVNNIANAILNELELHEDMHLLDFGSGTGLLLERLAPYVRKITAVDLSKSMNAQLEAKRDRLECELEIREVDLEISEISGVFDGIVSSMTMHHVRDIDAMFCRFYSMIGSGGVLGIADLDKEDGSFHTEDTGVHHWGFAREAIASSAERVGFRDVEVFDASIVSKPQGKYSVFLLTGRK